MEHEPKIVSNISAKTTTEWTSKRPRDKNLIEPRTVNQRGTSGRANRR
jgi:hypothetical protein